MRLLASSSEAEVIASWLRAEMGSARFVSRIGAILSQESVDPEIVTAPDLADEEQNTVRRSVLQLYRGYGTPDHNLLAGFPTVEVRWQRVTLTPDELLSVLYIDWDYWLKLSGGSRRPCDAARRILAGHVVYDVPNDAFLEVAAGVRAGRDFPPLIVVAAQPRARLVVIEGHSRLTGYALAADALPAETEVLLGMASALERWWAY
jgi:hypothetical protein